MVLLQSLTVLLQSGKIVINFRFELSWKSRIFPADWPIREESREPVRAQDAAEGGRGQGPDAVVVVGHPDGRGHGVKDPVVDDGVHREGDAVRGQDLLGLNLEHLEARKSFVKCINDGQW